MRVDGSNEPRQKRLRIVHRELAASLALFVAIGAFSASCSSNEGNGGGTGGKSGGGGAGARGGAGGKGITGGTAGTGGFSGTGTGGGSASGGSGGGVGTAGTFGTNGVGGSGGSGGSPKDSGPSDAPFVYDAPVATPDACATETRRAEQIPLDIYVMYDQSTSMTCLASGTLSRWGVVTPAFQSFLSSPQANGIGVGIQYFGQGGDCNAQLYFNPDVPIAPLPGNRAALENSLTAHATIGINLTTTNAAMIGAIDQAKARKNSNSTHAVVVLLVTDGQPNACGVVADVVNTARTGFTGNPSIRTFVLGIVASTSACGFDPNPPNVPDLNSVAAAGGTQQAYIVDPAAGNATQLLLNALDQIRGSATLPCQYAIPKPSGGLPDPSKVDVTFTPGGGGQPQKVPKVTDRNACTAGGGWYFDNNATPTAIILCPTTCTAASADINASVDVTIGCIRG